MLFVCVLVWFSLLNCYGHLPLSFLSQVGGLPGVVFLTLCLYITIYTAICIDGILHKYIAVSLLILYIAVYTVWWYNV